MKKIALFILIGFLSSCGSEEPAQENNTSVDWLIPQGEVLDGGPGKDGIPSVDAPEFSSVWDINFLNDDDLVIGMIVNGEARAYPHPILDWHEIVNDKMDDTSFALTYCPLTGTGVAWDRMVNGSETSFGVSGKLYNTNLMPYDRVTDSYWSQIRLDCVNGPLVGTKINTLPIIETSWQTWKAAYPSSQVMNLNTGFNRNYNLYPYGDYRTNDDRIIFPVSQSDDRLAAKERVLGILTENTNKVYSINLFDDDRIINDNFDDTEYMIIGSKQSNYIVVFERGVLENVSIINNALPIIAQDENGNKISLSGAILEGPLKGQQLNIPNAFMGYFFSFGAFYDVQIYE